MVIHIPFAGKHMYKCSLNSYISMCGVINAGQSEKRHLSADGYNQAVVRLNP